MQRIRTLLLILGVLLFCGQAFAQGSPTVYVTDSYGGHIYSFTTPSGPFTTVATISGHTLEGIEYGPDGRLFVCDPTNGIVYRVNPTGPVIDTVFAYTTSGPHHPQCGRFSSTGDFYVVDEFLGSGVWKFSAASLAGSLPATPTLVLSGAQLGGSGFGGDSSLTHANNGDLLISDFANGRLFLSAAPSFSSATQIASTLDNQTGIARSSTGDIFIAEKGGTNKIHRFSSTGTSLGFCGSFYTNDRPYFIKFSADDTLYVATSQDDSDEGPDNDNDPLVNGRIWSVNISTCAATKLTDMPTLHYSEKRAAIGIALPPTSTATQTKVITNPTPRNFNFNFTSFQISGNTPSPCSATVKATQTPLSDLSAAVAGIVPSLPTGTTLIPYLGEAGFGTVYEVSPTNCTSANALIGAFTDSFSNPRIIQCDPTLSGTCQVDNTSGVYPLGGPIPGDGAVGGGVPHFSKFFLVNSGVLTSTTGTDKAAKFCGFQFPLKNTLDPAIAPKFDDDDFILLSFRLALSTGNCKTGPFVDNAKVVVSLSQISPSFIPITNPNIVLTPNINGALFLHTYFGLIKVHGLPVGTYSLSYVFTTNNSPIVTTVFKVVPEGTPGSF